MKNRNEPAPVVVSTICSMCGLDWTSHGEKPTTEDCVRLLKAELARRPMPTVIIRDPYVQPWIVAPTRLYCSSTSNTIDVRTPAPAAIQCSSVAA